MVEHTDGGVGGDEGNKKVKEDIEYQPVLWYYLTVGGCGVFRGIGGYFWHDSRMPKVAEEGLCLLRPLYIFQIEMIETDMKNMTFKPGINFGYILGKIDHERNISSKIV